MCHIPAIIGPVVCVCVCVYENKRLRGLLDFLFERASGDLKPGRPGDAISGQDSGLESTCQESEVFVLHRSCRLSASSSDSTLQL